jgi:hypothetical protein
MVRAPLRQAWSWQVMVEPMTTFREFARKLAARRLPIRLRTQPTRSSICSTDGATRWISARPDTVERIIVEFRPRRFLDKLQSRVIHMQSRVIHMQSRVIQIVFVAASNRREARNLAM